MKIIFLQAFFLKVQLKSVSCWTHIWWLNGLDGKLDIKSVRGVLNQINLFDFKDTVGIRYDRLDRMDRIIFYWVKCIMGYS